MTIFAPLAPVSDVLFEKLRKPLLQGKEIWNFIVLTTQLESFPFWHEFYKDLFNDITAMLLSKLKLLNTNMETKHCIVVID